MTSKPSYEALAKRVAELEASLAQSRQKDASILRSEKLYRQLFQHMLHEIHVWELVRDKRGEIISWRLVDANPPALDAWQKHLPDIVGRTAEDVFPDSKPVALFMPVVREIFATGRPYTWESYFPSTGQTLFMVSIPIDEMFISVGMDVTRWKNAESKLRDTVLQLTEAISAGNVGLWDWNLVTNEVLFSREWKQQLGYADHELPNRYEEWEQRLHPDDKEAAIARVRQALEEKPRTYESEFRLQHKDGSYRWIFAHASLMFDEHDEPQRMVGSHIDITDRRQMESTLLQIQKMDALGTLAGGIAHDFNNLLAPILGYTELAKMNLPEQTPEQRYLANVEESANRAKDLVRKILMISKSSMAQAQSVDLKALVEEVVTVLEASAPKSITIDQDLDLDLPPICADPSQIYQVILNLCTNAIQAIEGAGEVSIRLYKGRPREAISLPAQERTEYLCLTVADNGCGIDAATMERIFDPFFTTKAMDGQRGTGLGLSIVSSVIKHHDGFIEVGSEPGKGTEFRVYFPVTAHDRDNPGERRDVPVSFTGVELLFVDDERMICDMADSIFNKLGIKATITTDPEKALAIFADAPDTFDLLITDHSMPRLAGPSLIERIKQIRSDIPVVLITGYTNLITPENLNTWQCAGMIVKPFKIADLRDTIAAVLSARENA